MDQWVLRHRARLYILVNVAVLIASAVGMLSGNASVGAVTYTCVLFMLCSASVLWVERLNDRHALLAVFMGTYFLFFGGLSLRLVLLGPESDSVPEVHDSFMTASQTAVLLGAALTLAGYRVGSFVIRPVRKDGVVTDWPNTAVLAVGLSCWILGSLAYAYYAIVVTPENSVRATEHGLASMGPMLTFAVMLGQLIQPLGLVMLAYGYTKSRTPFWLVLMLAVVFSQLLLGFVTDTKGTALLGILLVAITLALWDNKLPKGWVAGVVVFAILAFPVFQAARVERGERGLDRQQAFERFTEVLSLAWESRDKVLEGRPGARAQTFLERSSGEAALDVVFQHAGIDTPFLHGSTLVAIPFAFVPRLLLPDKQDVPVGQLYNHVFLHAPSDDFTYISFSQLGEFYWNFGWPGVVIGMLLTGFILGVTGANSSVAEVHSLTRLLVLLITIKTLCFGFGGSISLTYVVWMRALAAIGLLHLLFARPVMSVVAAPRLLAAGTRGAARMKDPAPIFPNLMR